MREAKKVYIELADGVTYDCEDNIVDVIKAIHEEHERNEDLTMKELLTTISIHGLTVHQVAKIYRILTL